MDRRTDFMEFIAENPPEELSGVYEKIMAEFQDNRESIISGFIAALEQALKECIFLQKQSKKGSVESIIISPTYYGMCTGSYELAISLFDERLYLDRAEAMSYWQADFVYKYVDLHMPIIKKALKKQFIRIKDYELDEFRQIYACIYHDLIVEPLILITEQVENNSVFREVQKQTKVRVLYGMYMDKHKEIRRISSGVGM